MSWETHLAAALIGVILAIALRGMDVPPIKRYVWEGEAVDSHLESEMNEEALNLSIRKFLKNVGVHSQREIEHAVQKAIDAGTIKGNETIPATMTLEVPGLGVRVKFDGNIELE